VAHTASCGLLPAGSKCAAPSHFAASPPAPVAASDLWHWANFSSGELPPVSLLIANAGMGTTGTRALHQFLCDRGYSAVHYWDFCNVGPEVRGAPTALKASA
jgi:hypothetical protein